MTLHTQFPRRSALLKFLVLLCMSHLAASDIAAEEKETSFSLDIQVDFGEDIGRNYGSLFEIVDQQGNVVAGAGFEGVFNTTGRGNRQRLSCFIKPHDEQLQYDIKRLPRSTTDAGVYLFDFQNRLYAQSASSGKDRDVRFFNGNGWSTDQATIAFTTMVAGKPLAVSSPRVLYDGKPILDLTAQKVTIARYYYASGHLFVRVNGEGINEIAACPWRPSQAAEIDYTAATKIPLRSPMEFVYAFGQWHDQVLVATNTGGVYRFADGTWSCLVEPILDVSYQVYTMINYKDRLLLGQYPTGELFEYDGSEVKQLKHQPPVMPGVSGSAREAQTSAIYGGDLYVGVWPWAELWRMDSDTGEWNFVRRMFTHPEITDRQTHPYETEATALGHVLNRWGHRITGLVPFNNSLFVSTSAKGSAPYEQSFEFLNAGDKWKDYGRVYELTLPGQVSIDTAWKNGRNNYRITCTPTTLTLSQDGGATHKTNITRKMYDAITSGTLKLREGVYGKFGGKLLSLQPSL